MVRHIVCWKLKEGQNTEENMLKMKRELCALKGKIEGLLDIDVGICYQGDFDCALHSVFESREALLYYRDHPEHKKVQAFIHTILESRSAADWEF